MGGVQNVYFVCDYFLATNVTTNKLVKGDVLVFVGIEGVMQNYRDGG